MLGVVSDLVMSCLNRMLAPDSENGTRVDLRDFSLSPATEGARTMKELLCNFPRHFASNTSLASLSCKYNCPGLVLY